VHGDMAQEAGGGGGESVSICTFVPVKQVNWVPGPWVMVWPVIDSL
jgi:hypothetical protein